jgi:NAD(P)-dependent dehydrogenase (short-subunit alcohol dehydrogenase family)
VIGNSAKVSATYELQGGTAVGRKESNRLRVAVVTGAAQGMGRTFALRLAKDRFAVAVLDISDEKLQDTCELIGRQGGTARAYRIDLTLVPQIEPLLERIEDDLGPIRVLVNNAAIIKTQPLLEVTEEDWDNIMAINAKALFFCLQAAGRRMIQRKSGSIINIASVAGRSARPKQTVYGASKAAVMHLTKSAAVAFGPLGVRVNAICPGVIETAMWNQVKSERTPEEVATILSSISLARTADPTEVAEVVAFLASDRAGYITGQAVNVCGGLEMD